ncbi:MAG: propanediol utilization protein [Proteobacteria bacterium]|nr:propanediol utilization protein [Pseudomonadota bacterium]MBS0572129.1 propanediol utilization protein [Pseudomonadota bacterium]
MIRVEGHFGELIQGRLGPRGPVALISLPCPALAVEARPSPLADPHGLLPPARSRALLAALDLSDPGPFTLSASMPRGGGAGASTAALVALARLAGSGHPPEALARACVAVEGASDPLMFAAPERLLWASRRATVLDRLPPLPRLAVIGGFFGPNRRTDPADEDFPDIADLVEPWRQAAAAGDLAGLAALASTSARRTLDRRGPASDPTEAIARATGALGHVIAHTGSARGLLFPEGSIPPSALLALAGAGFRRIVSFAVGGCAQ